jgi:DNA-3-methyladenine glycosylase I
MPIRCFWAITEDPLYLDYHDHEWGVPVHEDRHLFEFLILEGAQAVWAGPPSCKRQNIIGLDAFDLVAAYDAHKVSELLRISIVAIGLINAAIANAQSFGHPEIYGSLTIHLAVCRWEARKQCVVERV